MNYSDSKMASLRQAPICFIALLPVALRLQALRGETDSAYEVAVTKDQMVSMRDGVKLATDIYRLARNGSALPGKFPVILERTPYNKNSLSVAANHYVPHGYIVIAQDVRVATNRKGTGFLFATIRTMDLTPRNGLERSRGLTVISAPWAALTMARHSTRWRLRMLHT